MTIRLFLSYDGTEYNGWQIQNQGGRQNKNLKTIQGTLQSALRKLLQDETIEPVGSSRTDAGVHAREYVASFDVERSIVPVEKIAVAIGHLMPDSIVVYRSELARDGFNARFDTIAKTYRYYFYTGEFADPLIANHAWHVEFPGSLDIAAMNAAAACFCGTRDFDAFCADVKNAKTTRRTIKSCKVKKARGNMYYLEVTGDGFLYNMVRIITGTIVGVGMGKIPPEAMPAIIDSRDRTKAGITAPPQGLHLWKVKFKEIL